MYQTRGLFYPSLSQRVYQSNQGLKLAAKAVCHTKGEFICLKSFRLPNDSNIDMKHNRHCFLLFLLSPCPLPFPTHGPCLFGRRCSSDWSLPCPPAVPDSQTCLCVDAAVRTGFGIHIAHLRIWADRTCPCQLHPCLCQFPHICWGIWTMLKTPRSCWQALDGGAFRACCHYFSLTGSYVLL